MIGRRIGGLQATLFEGFEIINNPGVQYSVTTTIPGWTISVNVPNGAFVLRDTTWVRQGSQSLKLRGGWGAGYSSSYYIKVYRDIDVTYISKILIDLKTAKITTTAESASVYWNGVKILTINTPNVEMLNYEIDCSSLTGAKTLQFECWSGDGARSRETEFFIDNIRVI